MREKISVIVPVYNVEPYLCQCVDSIIRQTYPHLEIILVDDGSTDNSGIICDEYAKQYEQVLAIHKQNEGLGFARNTGLEQVTGQYVTFVDSDDWIERTLLEKLLCRMKEEKVDYCKSGFQRFKGDGSIISTTRYSNETYLGKEARELLLPRMLGASPTKHDSVEMCVCGVLFKSEIIQQNNIRFPSERVMISEDLMFNIDYLQYAYGACLIDLTGYKYRVNEKSLTQSYRADRFEACVFFYMEVRKKIKTLGYGKNTCLRLTRTFFIHTRMSIHQERHAVSRKSVKESRASILRICNDPILRKAIQRYPVHKLGIRQAFFLHLIKWRAAETLRIIAEFGTL